MAREQSVRLEAMTAPDIEYNVNRLRNEGWKMLLDPSFAQLRGENVTDERRREVDAAVSKIKESALLYAYAVNTGVLAEEDSNNG